MQAAVQSSARTVRPWSVFIGAQAITQRASGWELAKQASHSDVAVAPRAHRTSDRVTVAQWSSTRR